MQKFFLTVAAVLYMAVVFAQETETTGTDVNMNAESGAWYASPWVWVLGAAVFILLLLALTRKGSRKAE